MLTQKWVLYAMHVSWLPVATLDLSSALSPGIITIFWRFDNFNSIHNNISAATATFLCHECIRIMILHPLLAFMSVDRTTVQAADVGHTDEDEFDTTLHGPWMKRWEIVHHNRHTASMLASMDGQEESYKPWCSIELHQKFLFFILSTLYSLFVIVLWVCVFVCLCVCMLNNIWLYICLATTPRARMRSRG